MACVWCARKLGEQEEGKEEKNRSHSVLFVFGHSSFYGKALLWKQITIAHVRSHFTDMAQSSDPQNLQADVSCGMAAHSSSCLHGHAAQTQHGASLQTLDLGQLPLQAQVLQPRHRRGESSVEVQRDWTIHVGGRLWWVGGWARGVRRWGPPQTGKGKHAYMYSPVPPENNAPSEWMKSAQPVASSNFVDDD